MLELATLFLYNWFSVSGSWPVRRLENEGRSRGQLRDLECFCLLPSSQRSAGCTCAHAFSRLLSCSRCSAHVRRGVARAATSKGQGVFHSVALKGCCVLELATWFFFFGTLVFCFSFFGSGRRRETRFVLVRVAPQVGCRQTSHAQIATSPLRSLFCTQSTWRRSRCNVHMSERGFSVAQQRYKTAGWLHLLLTCLLVFFCFFCFRLFLFLFIVGCGRRRGPWHGYLSGGWDGDVYLAHETTRTEAEKMNRG